MSQTQYAFIKKSSVPTREAWQASIDALNFAVKLKLDSELEPFSDEGFSPCVWDDTNDDVGFEIFYETAVEAHEDDEDMVQFVGDRDYCISMCWRGEMKDCAAVMMASCALMRGFDAIVSCDGEKPATFEKLLSDTHDIVSQASA